MARYLSKEFIQYCQENKLEEVKACLTLKVDVNTVSEDGHWSGLTIAAKMNNLDLLDLLLSHPDIKINQKTEESAGGQSTALMFACEAGNIAIVSRLVKEDGLDINYQDGYTAAHFASYHRHTDCVRVLAGTGKVDWNIVDKWGFTPLFHALDWGHSDIIDILLEFPRFDFNVKTEDGESLAHAAVRGGVRIVETLANQEKFDCWNVPDKNGDTPVMMALKWGATDIVKVLVDCPRVDLTIRDKEGWTLVMRTIAGKELGEC